MAQRNIDDIYNRMTAKDSYKNRVLDGKRTTTDGYTGKIIYCGNRKNAKKKYTLKRTMDIDHVTPIYHVERRYRFLSEDRQRTIANKDYNYCPTNSELNRIIKNKKENHEVILSEIRKGENCRIDNITVKNMLAAEARSRICMSADVGKFMAQDFVQGAGESLVNNAIPMAISAVQNAVKVSTGEMTKEDAAYDLAKNTASAVVVGGTRKVSQNILKNSSKEILRKIGNSNEIALIIDTVVIVSKTTVRFLNGDINSREFFEEIDENGTIMIAGIIGGIAGGLAGSMIGIPPLIGEAVGSFIATAVCGELYRIAKSTKEIKLREDQIAKLCNEAVCEIDRQQAYLKSIIDSEYQKMFDAFSLGMEKIKYGVINNSFNSCSDGLSVIANYFDGDIIFKNEDDLDDLFEDAPLIIKGRGGF